MRLSYGHHGERTMTRDHHQLEEFQDQLRYVTIA